MASRHKDIATLLYVLGVVAGHMLLLVSWLTCWYKAAVLPSLCLTFSFGFSNSWALCVFRYEIEMVKD